MSFWCKHEWLKQSEVVLPSAYEQLNNEQLKNLRGDALDFFEKTHILILSCSKCGEIYKTVTRNFP